MTDGRGARAPPGLRVDGKGLIDLNGLVHVFAPDSVGLLVGLGLLGVLAMLVAQRRGLLPLRLAAGLLALLAVFFAGAASVNVYFGYFTTWADVTAGLGSGPAATAVQAARGGVLSPGAVSRQIAHLPAGSTGTLLSVPLFGHRSHVNRRGLVWLPPQYRQAAYAHTRFPVVELIPGTPGQPSDWITSFHVDTLLAKLTADRHIGPMVVVMAPSNPPIGRGHGEECTDKGTRGAQDSTYTGVDVPADVAAAFRVYPPGPHWAVAGYSSGGYCATDLTLRHPGTYGAVADLDGYLSPVEDGGLWHVIFYKDRTALEKYDITAQLPLDHHRLPPFYLAAGTGNREDIDDLVILRTLLRGRAAVTAVVDSGGHTFPVWRAEMPGVFSWIWDRINPHAVIAPVRGPRAAVRTGAPTGPRRVSTRRSQVGTAAKWTPAR